MRAEDRIRGVLAKLATRPPRSTSCPTSSSSKCSTPAGTTSTACPRSACSKTRSTASTASSSGCFDLVVGGLILACVAAAHARSSPWRSSSPPRPGLLPPEALRPRRQRNPASGNSARMRVLRRRRQGDAGHARTTARITPPRRAPPQNLARRAAAAVQRARTAACRSSARGRTPPPTTSSTAR